MFDEQWILVDTETTGFKAPIFAVDVAAQKMRGWQPEGPPLRCMIDHGVDIPAEACRVHGYTREILERDGSSPAEVYRALSLYVGRLPISAYNLAYDFDKVLVPEWDRLDIDPIGTKGFCTMQLAMRLLDPVPAGNCKLQTLRQYYRLPERGAHTALGDVETTVDLVQNVLAPIADARGLDSLGAIRRYLSVAWFPSRIPFGKFKGVDFRDATTDQRLYDWLEWLSESSNARSARMGQWYLEHLTDKPSALVEATSVINSVNEAGHDSIVVYANPAVKELEALVNSARAGLAEVESEYATERNAVDVVQQRLFSLLSDAYRVRDQLQLLLEYRQHFLEALLAAGEEAAEEIDEEMASAQAEQDRSYEEAAAVAENTRQLSVDEKAEIKGLFRKLARLFHPDRFVNDPDKHETYTKMMAIINQARDDSDIELLREIAVDPDAFLLKQGWASLDFSDEKDLAQLRKLYEALQFETMNVLEALNNLRGSPEYELMDLCGNDPSHLVGIATRLRNQLDEEIEALEKEVQKIETEIGELLDEG